LSDGRLIYAKTKMLEKIMLEQTKERQT